MKKSVLFGILFLIFIIGSIVFVSAARLPIVSGDDDAWGTVLNEFLNVSHNETGELKSDAVLNFTSNLTLGQKITFSLGEFLDNFADGFIRVNGNLNVTGNITNTQGINLTFPTCSGTEKLTFDGTSFSCATDNAGTSGSGIVESGNNSNGTYVKFADGTLVMHTNRSGLLTTSSSSGSSFAASAIFTFPLPVINIDNSTVLVSAEFGDAGRVWPGQIFNCNNNGCSAQIQGSANTATGYLRLHIIGRWTTLTNISVNDTTWAVNATTGNVGLFDSSKNVTIGKLLTFGLLETIDNLVDGWLRVNGNLNVTGNLSLGNGQISYNNSANSYYYYNGTQWVAFGTGTGGDSLWTNVSGTATYIGSVNITGNLTLGGDVTGQNTSRVRVTKGDAQTILDATDTKIQFNNETFDTLGEYDNVTNYRFTATQAGYYLVNALVRTASVAWNSGQGITTRLYKNADVYTNLGTDNADTALTRGLEAGGSSVVYLAVGDYIEIWVNINRGGLNTDTFSTNNRNNFFDVQRIHSPITIGSTAGVPEGAMVAFASSCPTGWTLNHTTNGTGIVDSGNTSGTDWKGSWIKYANGKMEVWAYNTTEVNITTAAGSGFYSSATKVPFPQTFSSVETVIPLADTVDGFGVVWADTHYFGLSTSSVSVRLTAWVSSYNGTAGAYVVGKWTETPQSVLNWCVKTGEDSSISNTIWATSGNNIIMNNQSKSLNLSNTSTTYYTPNASEQSAGTLHLLPTKVTVVSTNPGAAGWNNVSLASYVPAGTKAVYLGMYIAGSTVGTDYGTLAKSATENTGAVISQYVQTAAVGNQIQGIIEVNATRYFSWYVPAATVSNIEVYLFGYYI